MSNTGKVFGIGFQKTGTSSLAASLYVLGYNVCGYYGNDDPNIAKTALPTAFEMADRYDAAQDMPWPVLYRELDARYPGSKFILTVRDSDSWVRSVVAHFKSLHIDSHVWIYGVPTAAGHEDVYVERFERHNREVIAYFADRPDDLLVIDLTTGSGWDRLCPFLGLPIPDVSYPRQNTREQKIRTFPRRAVGAVTRRTGRAAADLARSGHGRAEVTRPQQKENDVARKMSADVVRETVHFHYDTMVGLVDALERAMADGRSTADPDVFVQAERLVEDQTRLERQILVAVRAGLTADAESEAPDNATSGAPGSGRNHDLLRTITEARTTRDRVRHYLANADDLAVNRRLPGRSERVWQAFIQLQQEGAERRSRLRFLLEHMGVEHDTVPYIDLGDDRRAHGPDPLGAIRGLLSN